MLEEGEGELMCSCDNEKGEMSKHQVWSTVEKVIKTLLTLPTCDCCPSLGSFFAGAEPLDALSSWVMQLKALHSYKAKTMQRMCGSCDPGWQKLLSFCVLVTSLIPRYRWMPFKHRLKHRIIES